MELLVSKHGAKIDFGSDIVRSLIDLDDISEEMKSALAQKS